MSTPAFANLLLPSKWDQSINGDVLSPSVSVFPLAQPRVSTSWLQCFFHFRIFFYPHFFYLVCLFPDVLNAYMFFQFLPMCSLPVVWGEPSCSLVLIIVRWKRRGGGPVNGPEFPCFQGLLQCFLLSTNYSTPGISQIISGHLSATCVPSVNSAVTNLSPPGLIGPWVPFPDQMKISLQWIVTDRTFRSTITSPSY